ncbi:efflux RND transporter periplasmic adaptor subunit [Pseudomonas helleri]|uniref:Efflux RND transporter periplasmic adaptor subunit n=1 Tax=Pseudomonas helleri TaxID=1608996 RepID=A0A6A7YLG8_9PSED|nr:efflux RND transporter periplasmic adaptor subunit [Pseudomonas helleri]MQT32352.1 efflux RND transporter periplasmic adaptor subunit [Pseudomonas helleri]MQT45798.1 efflux RND transporter periplasmic adaptor subunit [Pseudomonas helleri]MQT90340.1 efflux RND transporter periplasmic adaptor subunit [Pseudomonas helleri]
MTFNKTKVTGLVVAALALGVAAGWWAGQPRDTGMAPSMAPSAPKALYWYDPMFPQQKFDKPGKSPFMDMQLVAQYADDKADAQTLRVDPGQTENLGVRLATVSRGMLATRVMASGVLGFNERDVAVIQARTPGFVERVYNLAPGDVLKPDAALADVLVPEWAAAQEEFLALKRVGDSALLAAARQRLRLTGMPPALIAQVERSGKVQPVLTVTSPVGGVLQTLNVRQGMTLGLGETLAQVNGLGSVWLTVAVPEAQAAAVAPGQTIEARLPAFAGEVFKGTVSAILPQTNADSRTLQVRVELANPGARLRPGLTAQVSLEQSIDQHVLWVPSEAVIRTGHQALVMLAEEGGHYRPVEVRTGSENDGQTAILQGLQEGQQVVSSGQFLLDSEASLKGLDVTPLAPNLPTGSQP